MVTKKKRFLNCIDTNHQPCPSVILDQLQGSDSAHYPRCFPHVSNAASRPTPFWNKHTAHARDGWDRAIHSLALTTTFATLQTRSRRKQLRNWIALYRLRLWDLGKSPRLLSTRLMRLTVSEEWRPAWWQQNFKPTKVKQKRFPCHNVSVRLCKETFVESSWKTICRQEESSKYFPRTFFRAGVQAFPFRKCATFYRCAWDWVSRLSTIAYCIEGQAVKVCR